MGRYCLRPLRLEVGGHSLHRPVVPWAAGGAEQACLAGIPMLAAQVLEDLM